MYTQISSHDVMCFSFGLHGVLSFHQHSFVHYKAVDLQGPFTLQALVIILHLCLESYLFIYWLLRLQVLMWSADCGLHGSGS